MARPARRAARAAAKRPIMAVLDLITRRWALRVIWSLRQDRLTFRALQEACGGASPNVLSQRLKELRAGGIVDLGAGGGYGLTPLGRDFRRAAQPMLRWSERWARAISRRPVR